MKLKLHRIIFFLLLCVVGAKIVIAEDLVGNCNLAISNNSGGVTINGNIHLECGSISNEEFRTLQAQVGKYNANFENLKMLYEDVRLSNISLRIQQKNGQAKIKFVDEQLIEFRKQQNLSEERLQNIWAQHEQLRGEVANSYAELLQTIGRTAQESLDERSKWEQKIESATGNLYQKLDIALRQNEKRIQTLEQRVDKVENDNAFLMDAWMKGNLVDSVGYISGSTGAWHSEQGWGSKSSIEYERLTPYREENNYLKNLSFFGEIGLLKWTETIKFKTLPGVQESELINNHKIVNLSLGTRAFFKLDDESHYYLLLSIGHSMAGSEDTFSYATGAGIEYTRKSIRASMEIRWEGFCSVEQTSVTFNAFGNTRTERNLRHQSGPLLAARLAFR